MFQRFLSLWQQVFKKRRLLGNIHGLQQTRIDKLAGGAGKSRDPHVIRRLQNELNVESRRLGHHFHLNLCELVSSLQCRHRSANVRPGKRRVFFLLQERTKRVGRRRRSRGNFDTRNILALKTGVGGGLGVLGTRDGTIHQEDHGQTTGPWKDLSASLPPAGNLFQGLRPTHAVVLLLRKSSTVLSISAPISRIRLAT